MDSSESIRNLRENLAEIDRVLAWVEKSGELHQLDRDLLLGKIRNLYGALIDFHVDSKAPESAAMPVFEPEVEPEVEQELEPEVEPEVEPAMVPEFDLDFEPEPQWEPESEPVPEPVPIKEAQKPEPVFRPEPVTIPEPEFIPEPKVKPEPVFRPEPVKPKPPVRETIADTTHYLRDDSLNDVLGKQKPVHDIASTITETPVSDIWSAITINERFLFIRELFANDAEGFKKTVSHLNSLDSWENARIHLEGRFSWKAGDQVASDFMNVVRRRFL